MAKPEPSEYSEFYSRYISLVNTENVLDALKATHESTKEFIKNIPQDKVDFKYAPDKWMTKQVIGHILDTERVMSYRALRFARGDATGLAGFEEKDYARNDNINNRSLEDLSNEYYHLRSSTIDLFSGFTDEMLIRSGMANGNPITVRALGFIIAGHELHHLSIIRERYL